MYVEVWKTLVSHVHRDARASASGIGGWKDLERFVSDHVVLGTVSQDKYAGFARNGC